jgi:DNA polymerase-3 subunit alpha
VPLHVRLDAARLPATVIDELKHVLGNFPGESEVVLDIQTSEGSRVLRLGPDFKVACTPSLRAELEHILGAAAVLAREGHGG